MKFSTAYGDIVKLAKAGYIVHGVNCRNVMGSGVAKAIADAYPVVKGSYHALSVHNLGTNQYVKISDTLCVVNAHTQFDYGYDGRRYVSYDAIVSCFEDIANNVPDGSIIWIPKIGADRGGGNFDAILTLITSTLEHRDVHLILVNYEV